MIAILALAAALPCPVERARYVLRGRPDVTARFRAVESGPDWPAGVALGITRAGRTSWWLPWTGGTDGRQNVASTTDVTAPGWRPPSPDGGPRPLGNRQYLGADGGYGFLDDIPRRGRAAPAHILFLEAGGARDELFPVRQFFDLAGC